MATGIIFAKLETQYCMKDGLAIFLLFLLYQHQESCESNPARQWWEVPIGRRLSLLVSSAFKYSGGISFSPKSTSSPLAFLRPGG